MGVMHGFGSAGDDPDTSRITTMDLFNKSTRTEFYTQKLEMINPTSQRDKAKLVLSVLRVQRCVSFHVRITHQVPPFTLPLSLCVSPLAVSFSTSAPVSPQVPSLTLSLSLSLCRCFRRWKQKRDANAKTLVQKLHTSDLMVRQGERTVTTAQRRSSLVGLGVSADSPHAGGVANRHGSGGLSMNTHHDGTYAVCGLAAPSSLRRDESMR
jgi:hypothetical protein